MRVRALSSFLLASLSLGLALPAAGQPADTDAALQAEFDAGIDDFNRGLHQEAWGHFIKANKLAPDKPGPLRWLGITAQALGKYEECIDYEIQAIRSNPKSSQRKRMIDTVVACRVALGRPALTGEMPEGQGSICVTSSVEGASVLVDEIKRGATPLAPFPVNPGMHRIQINRAGYLPAAWQVDVIPGVIHDVDLKLERDPHAKGTQDSSPRYDAHNGWLALTINVGANAAVTIDGERVTPGPDGAVEQPPGEHVVVVEAPGHEAWRRRVVISRGQKHPVHVELRSQAKLARQRRLAYLALGAATLAASGGVVTGLLESSTFEQARDWAAIERIRPTTGTTPPELPEATIHTRQDIADLEAKGRRYSIISNLSYGVALAAFGASCYFFIHERSPERRGFPLPLAVMPALSPDGLAGAMIVLGREIDF